MCSRRQEELHETAPPDGKISLARSCLRRISQFSRADQSEIDAARSRRDGRGLTPASAPVNPGRTTRRAARITQDRARVASAGGLAVSLP